MNERIKELAKEAGYTPLPGFDFANELQEVFLKKFAELIVRECANVAFDDWCEGTNESSSEIAILKHFNVGIEK